MSNQRRSSRQTVNAPAWMDIGRDARRRCRLIDISANGARLVVDDIETTPDSFDLRLSRFGRAAYHCNVIWRRGNEVGVEFLAAPAAEVNESIGASAI
jgi:PilZ domain